MTDRFGHQLRLDQIGEGERIDLVADEGECGAICKRLSVTNANCYVLLHRARQFLHQRFAAEAFAA